MFLILSKLHSAQGFLKTL